MYAFGIQALAYGYDKFVAGGDASPMLYSKDGKTWTAVTDSTLYFINAITYGNNKFIAGGNGGKMEYSSDGIKWTLVDSKLSHFNAVAFGKDKFIAMGNFDDGDNGKIAYSSDGTTWTAITTPFASVVAIAYGKGKFVAGGGGYSHDGRHLHLLLRRNGLFLWRHNMDNSTEKHFRYNHNQRHCLRRRQVCRSWR